MKALLALVLLVTLSANAQQARQLDPAEFSRLETSRWQKARS
jgi:hypothetical protein